MFVGSAGERLGLNRAELALFRKLSTPEKVQSFIGMLKCNFETKGDTCFSVRTSLTRGEGHCIEAAVRPCSWISPLKAMTTMWWHCSAKDRIGARYRKATPSGSGGAIRSIAH